MTLVFTLCSNNYLAQAMVLGETLISHNPEYQFKIGLVDKKCKEIDYSCVPYEIIETEKIGIKAFDDMFRRYSVTELNTAVKPFFFLYLFENFPVAERIIFLDPDISVYNSFSALDDVLDSSEIVLTPHFTTPINDDKFQAENNFLNSGIYNLGFIALKKGDESKKLLDWWADRLETKAFIDFRNGLFTDQIWMNFAPLFFKNVHILAHPGYNMAYWNLHERYLTPGGEVEKNGMLSELVFFHFSGYNPLVPETLSKYQNRFSFSERLDIKRLFEEYRSALLSKGYQDLIRISSYYAAEKQKLDLETYRTYKESIPVIKRIVRGIILRIIKWFKIDVFYYTTS